MDCSLPGFSIHRILQARTLEWVAISFSSASKWKVKVKSLSRVWLLATPWTAAHQAPLSMGFSRQEYWSGVPLPSPNIVYSLWQTRRKTILITMANIYWTLSAKKCTKCFPYTPSYDNNDKLNAAGIYTTWRSLTLNIQRNSQYKSAKNQSITLWLPKVDSVSVLCW